jgi:DNA uptake protein ComE-like DNA-binding protein
MPKTRHLYPVIRQSLKTAIQCVFFFIILSLQLAGAPLKELKDCTLIPTDWADGDSFLVRDAQGEEFTVRLYGADCIEWHVTDESDERRLRAQRRYFGITQVKPTTKESIQLAKSFGEKAGKVIRTQLAKPFTIHTSFADARGDGKFKRVYAFVITSDGKDLSAHLVKTGLARAFGVARQTYDNRSGKDYREFLKDLELQAAKRSKGIWAVTNWDSLPVERHEQREADRETELAFDNQKAVPGERLNPNTAPRDALMKLPGIGEELANRIIEARPFAKANDLLEVSGIGPARLKRIAPHLEFSK